VAIVGAGRVGTALAVLLARAGHRLRAVTGGEASRARAARYLDGVPFVTPAEAVDAGHVILLGVPDDRIAPVCGGLHWRPGQTVAHLSGSVSLDALAVARKEGARALSLHPLQTIPEVDAGVERIPGSRMAVTAEDEDGYALGERLAADAGAIPFRLPDERKPLYHAAAVFASNYLAVVEGAAVRLMGAAGVEDPLGALAPLARAGLDNVLERGPSAALTGPAARGDAATVGRNLDALSQEAPDLVPAYVALADAALDMAEAAGRVDHGARERVEEVLARWR
jgi:predicted short-subunit dehydrogenase-like oxidoreductase (DUF2520 family)